MNGNEVQDKANYRGGDMDAPKDLKGLDANELLALVSPHNEDDQITDELRRRLERAERMEKALRALRDAVKANPAMQGREYVQLGIQVNAALEE